MPERDVKISISSNNSEIEEVFLDKKLHSEISFVNSKSKTSYKLFLIDVSRDLTQISQKLIDTYGICRDHDSKLAVVILHGENVDIEKNHYFQKMLDDLGKDKPLHRLVFTKDLYQHTDPIPSTPLDLYFHNAVTKNVINISEKGENIIYPLSVEDFIAAIIKTLFLSNTSGKSFWLLGDSITDLELSYLIKKSTSRNDQEELEINAVNKFDPKVNSLLSLGNKARAELNWQPEKEIIDDIKQIVDLYNELPVAKENNINKINPVHRLINWLYRPKPISNPHLPTLRKVALKLISVALLAVIMMGVIVIASTGLSLLQLEKSINFALNGNIKKSVSSLENAKKLKEMGESTFTPIVPISNLVSLTGTEKMFNLYKLIDYSISSLGNLHQTYVIAENLLMSLNSDENKVNYNDLSLGLHSNLSQVYENLNQISLLSSGNKIPQFLDKKLKQNVEFGNLTTLEKEIVEYMKVVDIIPSVLSGNKAKNIIVLLQNSNIRQPSGGEIDHYLLLTIDNGRLIGKQYYTEAELEKLYIGATVTDQKNKKVAAPIAPRLSDLAQNPDFSTSSNNVSQYLEKAIKIKPDFIIATSDLLIKQLLLEEKSQIVDQFQLNLESSSISAVYKELVDQYVERLFNQDISLPVLGRTIAKIIGDNQLYIWSSDPNIEHQLAAQSYSGVIALHPCNAGIDSAGKCIAQTSYLCESSAQSSRQNPWKSRSVTHTIKITPSQVQHEYKVDFKRKDLQISDSIVATTFHLYLPTGSAIDKVLLNDLPASTKDIQKNIEGSFDHYKIPVAIYSDRDNTLIIKVNMQYPQPFAVPYSYSITEYRQPGTQDPGISLQISYPENLRPAIATSTFTAEPSQMKISLPPHTSTFGFTLDQNTR